MDVKFGKSHVALSSVVMEPHPADDKMRQMLMICPQYDDRYLKKHKTQL